MVLEQQKQIVPCLEGLWAEVQMSVSRLESSWGSGKGARDLWALVASGIAYQQEAIFFLLPLPLIPCVCPCVQIPTSGSGSVLPGHGTP